MSNSSGLNASRDNSISSNSMRSINGDDNTLDSTVMSNINLLSSTASGKLKVTKEDCLKLIKQSIKCCHVTMELHGGQNEVFIYYLIY